MAHGPNSTEEEHLMRTLFQTAITGTLALLFLGTVFVSKATAQCGYAGGHTATVQPQHWQGPAPFRPASFLLVAHQDSDDRIVGFWKVEFVLDDGTVIDHGFAQWHSDGTEIMNSSRPPATSNFCLGVWQKSGPSRYKLNHFGLSWDPNGNFIGPARIQEDVILDHSGNNYVGTFTIDQYDPSGNLLAHIAGQVTATRVTVDTPVEDVL
jgi:hypothetical protein